MPLNPPNAIVLPLIGSYVIARPERAGGELVGESAIQSGTPEGVAATLAANAIEIEQQIKVIDAEKYRA